MKPTMSQQTRASLEFVGAVSTFSGGNLRTAARAEYERAGVADPKDLWARRELFERVLGESPAWQFDRFFTRWVAEEQWVVGTDAVEEARAEFERWLEVPDDVPGKLVLDPELQAPEYWQHEFHLTPGGWDGHDLQNCMISDLVYPYVIVPAGVGGAATGENVFDQRALAAREAPRKSYRRILEPGAGTGRFCAALQREYPDAKVIGVELSATALRRGRAIARDNGWDWDLYQAPAERMPLPDAHVDLVAFYVLFHEVARDAVDPILTETFRVLEPGGDVLIADLAPYELQDAFSTVMLDWETEYRGEPHWRAAMQNDIPGALARAGFVDVTAYGVGERDYPWIIRARKPEEAA